MQHSGSNPQSRSAERRAAIAQWEKYRAMGRTDFIVRRGVLGWGMPAAVLAIAYKAVQEQGLHLSLHMTGTLRSAIIIALTIFPLCGWLFGRWLWTTGEARYRTMRGENGNAAGRPRDSVG